jgi:hypothetical protein
MKVTFTIDVAGASGQLAMTVVADVEGDGYVRLEEITNAKGARIPLTMFQGDVLMAFRKRAREEAKRG